MRTLGELVNRQIESGLRLQAHQFHLPCLIADALPDGWGLLLGDRLFKKGFGLAPHRISPLDLLAFIADRAMGALTFKPVADVALPPPDLQLLALAPEVQAVIADHDSVALRQLLVIGGTPQGARPKAKALAKNYAIRPATRSKIAKAIEGNRLRMA